VILPVSLALLGVALIVAAEIVARRLAPRYVMGRTLAAARDVSIEEALELANSGRSRYVRIHGRISSDEEFPDEHDRPLVYRRKRVEVRQPDGQWQAVAAETEGVPFGVEARSSFISVDNAALGDGLVVVPRHADGVAADLPPDIVAAIDPALPARLIIEQVSAVEHAFVAGVPRAGRDGQLEMSSGNNRPLILTTLDIDAAMRLLGRGQRAFALAMAGSVGLGIVLLAAAALTLALGVGIG
jgi:hypothetical protein